MRPDTARAPRFIRTPRFVRALKRAADGRDDRLGRLLETQREAQDIRLLPGVLLIWGVSAAVVFQEPPLLLTAMAAGSLAFLSFLIRRIMAIRRRPPARGRDRRDDASMGVAGAWGTLGLTGLLVLLGALCGLTRLTDAGNLLLEEAITRGSPAAVEFQVTGRGPAQSPPGTRPAQEASESADRPSSGPTADAAPQAGGAGCGDGCPVTAVLQALTVSATRHPLSVPVSLRCGASCGVPPAVGARYSGFVRFSRKPDRPGRLDGSILATPRALTSPSRLEEILNSVRGVFLARSSRTPGETGALVEGMVLGERSRSTPLFKAVMMSTGLTHLTAVSGANCSIIFATVLLGARSLRMPRAPAALAGLASLGAFALLVGPDPSVLRAAVMSAASIAVLSGGHRNRGLPLLCASASVLLLTEPGLALDPGFALSVAATGGIVLAARPAARLLGRIMPYGAALALAIPFVAQSACAPLLVLLSPGYTPYAVPANVLAAPLVAPVTLLGTAALLLLPVWPWFGDLVYSLAEGCATVVWGIARTFHDLPGAMLDWPPGVLGLVTMAALGLLQLALLWSLAHPARIGAAYRRAHAALAGRSPKARYHR